MPKGFEHLSFYEDIDGAVKTLIITSCGIQLRKDAIMNGASLLLPTFGDDHIEASVHCSPHQVKLQYGLDQGVPWGLDCHAHS